MAAEEALRGDCCERTVRASELTDVMQVLQMQNTTLLSACDVHGLGAAVVLRERACTPAAVTV